jgi:hypothetical protein
MDLGLPFSSMHSLTDKSVHVESALDFLTNVAEVALAVLSEALHLSEVNSMHVGSDEIVHALSKPIATPILFASLHISVPKAMHVLSEADFHP